jgi:hypothetical protein
MRKLNYFTQTKLSKKGTNKYGGSSLIEGTLLKGRMLLSDISVPAVAQDAKYTDIFAISLNPQSFQNTKLAVTAALYTKFKFRSFDVQWIPSLGTTYANPIAIYCVRDPEMKLNGAPGTFAYAQAISQLPDVHTFPIWQEQTARFRFSNDGSSFFINPDVDGEDRFTNQGQVSILIYGAPFVASSLGLVAVTYECEMWEPTFSVNAFQGAIQIPSWNISTPSTSTLVDNIGGYVSVYFPAGGDPAYAALSLGTVYQAVTTYTMGHFRAWQIGWFKTPASYASATSSVMYKTKDDAVTQSGENIYDGSFRF